MAVRLLKTSVGAGRLAAVMAPEPLIWNLPRDLFVFRGFVFIALAPHAHGVPSECSLLNPLNVEKLHGKLETNSK